MGSDAFDAALTALPCSIVDPKRTALIRLRVLSLVAVLFSGLALFGLAYFLRNLLIGVAVLLAFPAGMKVMDALRWLVAKRTGTAIVAAVTVGDTPSLCGFEAISPRAARRARRGRIGGKIMRLDSELSFVPVYLPGMIRFPEVSLPVGDVVSATAFDIEERALYRRMWRGLAIQLRDGRVLRFYVRDFKRQGARLLRGVPRGASEASGA